MRVLPLEELVADIFDGLRAIVILVVAHLVLALDAHRVVVPRNAGLSCGVRMILNASRALRTPARNLRSGGTEPGPSGRPGQNKTRQ